MTFPVTKTRTIGISNLLLLLPIADAMTGYLVLNHFIAEGALLSPSQLYRFLLVLFLFSSSLPNRLQLGALVGIMGYMLGVELIAAAFYTGKAIGFMVGGATVLKILFLALLVIYFSIRWRRDPESTFEEIAKLALIYGVILVTTTIAGYNKPTYAEGTFGSKGVFSSGNGLSFFLGSVSSLCAVFYWERKNQRHLYYLFFLVTCTLLVGTKASLMFSLVSLSILFLVLKTWQKWLVAILLLMGLSVLVSLFGALFEVILFRLNNSSNLFSFLASGRDGYVTSAWQQFEIGGTVPRFLFGSGALQSFYSAFQTPQSIDYLENDVFDLLFMYGFVGLSIYLAIVTTSILNSIRSRRFFRVILICLCAGYSAVAGHVLFDGMAAIPFAAVVSLGFTTRRDNAYRIHHPV